MTARQVDALLDERVRLTMKNAATSGHLWAAEFLLKRVGKLLPDLIAQTPVQAILRDTIVQEIAELLAEDRDHPGPLDLEAGAEGEAAPASSTPEATS